jgi:hypothetical protein
MPSSPIRLVPRRGASRSRARATPGERGAAWVNLLLLLALAVAGYLAWVWLPVYADHYQVKQTTRDYMNRAVKDRNDAALVAGLSGALLRIGHVRLKDEEGTVYDVPAVDVPPDAISWERDTSGKPPVLRVSFEYERTIVLPFLDRTTVKHFSVELETDITVPTWD